MEHRSNKTQFQSSEISNVGLVWHRQCSWKRATVRDHTDWFFPIANARHSLGNKNLTQQRTIAYSRLSKYNNFVCLYHIFAVTIFRPVSVNEAQPPHRTNSRSEIRGAGRAAFWSVDVLLV